MRGAFRVGAVLALAASAVAAVPEVVREVPIRAPNRYAVIVGVNDYANFEGVEGGDLRGAVNDARSMADVLIAKWGFKEDNVLLLLDADAPREGIRTGLTEWMARRVRPGDLALFFFAGHGSQTLDMEGDEEDGLDETIAPQDVLATSSERDITDDELRSWLQTIPTDQIIAAFDACHSGTATRAVSTRMRPRSLPREAPKGIGTRGDAEEDPGILKGVVALELAAAAPDQVAMDALFAPQGGTTPYAGGAFTTHLVRQLWRAEPGASYVEVFRAAFEAMKAERFVQDPQIDGALDAPLFALGDDEAPNLSRGEVQATETPDGLRLQVGPVQGVTVGSLYAMGGELVRVENVEVGGALVAPVTRPPVFRDVARLAAHVPDVPALRVRADALDETVVAGIRQGLGDLRVYLVSDDQADLFLVPDEDGRGLSVLTAEGAVRARVVASGGDVATSVARTLRQEWAAQRIAALDNPSPDFDVTLSFVQGTQDFRQRDPIAFRVTSGRDGYLTLIDLGTDGTVTVLYPNRFVPEGRIQAGAALDVPTSAMPFRLRASGPEGWGMVRAVVTQTPLALGETDEPLLSNREGVVLAETAARALHQALAGLWDGAAPLGDALPVEGWATAVANYRIIP